MKIYCLQCKKRYEIDKVTYRIVKGRGGKRKMAQGKCPKGHKVNKFVKM
jgi:hypothetical protein